MKRIWKLFRAMNKNSPLPDGTSGKHTGPSIWVFIGVVLAVGIGFLSCVGADFITMLGGSWILVLLIGFMAYFMIFCLGIMSLINTMYMSSDIEMLITLPFSATQIVMLKTLSYFQYAFGGCAAMLLTSMIGYTIAASTGPLDWVTVILTCILVPVTGVSLAVVVVVLLMSFLKIFRNRDTLRVIGAFLLFAAFCGYLFFASNENNIDAQAALTQVAAILKFVKYTVPVVGFLTDFMQTGSILALLCAILCTAVPVGLFMLVTKKLYLTGALNMQDAGRGKMLTDADLDKACRKKSVLNALITKEFFSVRRNPAYLMNNFIMGALWPAAVLIIFKQMIPLANDVLKGGLEPGFSAFAFYTVFLSLAGLIFVYIPITMQNIAYTSLSREGTSFPIMKQLPVAYETQIEAKRRMAEYVSLISISGYSFLILIAASILLKFPVVYGILPLILVTLYAELGVNLDMYFGILDADVLWDDEKEVQQKSFSRQWPMMLLWAVFFVLALSMAIELVSLIAGLIILFAIGVGMLVASLILRKQIRIRGEKKIRSLHF